MRESLQDLNYRNKNSYLQVKLLKEVNGSLGIIISVLSIIAVVEFIRFCFDLYTYLH